MLDPSENVCASISGSSTRKLSFKTLPLHRSLPRPWQSIHVVIYFCKLYTSQPLSILECPRACWLQCLFLSYGICPTNPDPDSVRSELVGTANRAEKAALKSVCHPCDSFCPDLGLMQRLGTISRYGWVTWRKENCDRGKMMGYVG